MILLQIVVHGEPMLPVHTEFEEAQKARTCEMLQDTTTVIVVT